MRFSHKVSKLARPLTYRRAWRRAERFVHPLPLAPLLAKIDQAGLAELRRRHASSTEHYAKYADVKRWLRLNIVRAQDLKLHRCPPQSVLDLGCGGGFFLFVLRQLGHSCLGLDIDVFPLFAELLDLFRIERRVWAIRPYEPLPDLGRRFDLITAFSIDFNRESKREWWWGRRNGLFFSRISNAISIPVVASFSALTRGEMESITPLNYANSSSIWALLSKGKTSPFHQTSCSDGDGTDGMKSNHSRHCWMTDVMQGTS